MHVLILILEMFGLKKNSIDAEGKNVLLNLETGSTVLVETR